MERESSVEILERACVIPGGARLMIHDFHHKVVSLTSPLQIQRDGSGGYVAKGSKRVAGEGSMRVSASVPIVPNTVVSDGLHSDGYRITLALNKDADPRNLNPQCICSYANIANEVQDFTPLSSQGRSFDFEGGSQ